MICNSWVLGQVACFITRRAWHTRQPQTALRCMRMPPRTFLSTTCSAISSNIVGHITSVLYYIVGLTYDIVGWQESRCPLMTSPFLSSKSLLTHYNLKVQKYSFFTPNLIFPLQTGSEANSYQTTAVQRN